MLAALVLAADVTLTSEVPANAAVPLTHTAALFGATRFAEAILYPDPFADQNAGRIGRHYRDAYTMPPLFDVDRRAFEWDGDPWTINVIGHALMGSESYVRARACAFGPLGALAFTAAATVAWEYVFEANGVRPSAWDLVYTPAAGLALGELRFQIWRAAGESRGWRGVVRAVVDPFGELERAALRTRC